MRQEISKYQKKLRLSSNLIDLYQGIPFDNKDQFIRDLLKALYNERIHHVMERNMKAAKFPGKKLLEGYSFANINIPESLSIESMKELSFMEEKQNLIFYGNVGTGKTHLSIGLGIRAINRQKVVYFYTVHELVNTLIKVREEGSYQRFMKKLQKADLLILDEWGYLPLHQEGARLLFEVISMCYEQRSLIITTNLEFSHWKNFLFDEKLTAAIIDRIVHHAHLLFFDGPSYRKENALLK